VAPAEAGDRVESQLGERRLRLLTILPERGRVTNAEIRRLSGYSRTQVLKLMRSFRREGLVRVQGWGRGAHYVPADPE